MSKTMPDPFHPGTPGQTLPCTAAPNHLVLIPSYNTGRALLRKTVAAALSQWQPVWVVIDGSTDGSDTDLETLATELLGAPPSAPSNPAKECSNTNAPPRFEQPPDAASPAASSPEPTAPLDAPRTGLNAPRMDRDAHSPPLRILRLRPNGGKGHAVHEAMRIAQAAGFTHALCFDADGQHPAGAIPPMMRLSAANPQAVIMGQPIFGSDAPAERLFGRKIANFFTEWESGHCGLGDTLFGMRVYPLAPSIAAMEATRFARRFDFDPEIAVRLCWQGVQPLPYPVPCRYLSKSEGGVSHFNYLRDNIFQIFLHFRLLPRYLLGKWLTMRTHKRRWQAEATATQHQAHTPPHP